MDGLCSKWVELCHSVSSFSVPNSNRLGVKGVYIFPILLYGKMCSYYTIALFNRFTGPCTIYEFFTSKSK